MYEQVREYALLLECSNITIKLMIDKINVWAY